MKAMTAKQKADIARFSHAAADTFTLGGDAHANLFQPDLFATKEVSPRQFFTQACIDHMNGTPTLDAACAEYHDRIASEALAA